jgi:Transcriptional Coactivator p15 (PC4)
MSETANLNARIHGERDLPVTITEWRRNARETVRVRLDEFNGCQTIDCRVWYRSPSGELRPGRAGLTLSVAHLQALADALAAALAEAKRLGLKVD